MAYVWSILIGALLLLFGANGHVTVLCIACNSAFLNILAVISIIVGITGLVAGGARTAAQR